MAIEQIQIEKKLERKREKRIYVNAIAISTIQIMNNELIMS